MFWGFPSSPAERFLVLMGRRCVDSAARLRGRAIIHFIHPRHRTTAALRSSEIAAYVTGAARSEERPDSERCRAFLLRSIPCHSQHSQHLHHAKRHHEGWLNGTLAPAVELKNSTWRRRAAAERNASVVMEQTVKCCTPVPKMYLWRVTRHKISVHQT